MEHTYLSQYHDAEDEPVAEPLELDDDKDMSVDHWKRLIWDEILDFEKNRIVEQGSEGMDAETEQNVDIAAE